MNSYLIVTLFCIILYVKSLWNKPVVDEKWGRDNIRPWFLKPHHFRQKFYGAGTFKNIYLDRAFTILLFTSICLLVNKLFGLLPALLYASNPINNQISIWMNGRRYAINIIIALSCLINPLFLPLYLITPFLQINVITFPLLFLFLHSPHLALLFISAFCLFICFGLQIYSERFEGIKQVNKKKFKPKKLIIMVKTLGFYLINSLIPTAKMINYSYLEHFELNEDGNNKAYAVNKDFYFKLLLLTSFALFGVFNYDNIVGFCVLAWFLTMLQWSNLITFTQTLADRYCAFSSIFLMVILSYILPNYLVLFILGSYTLSTYNQIGAYRNPEFLSFWHMYYQPNSIETYYCRALTCIKHQDYTDALCFVKRGLAHNNKDFRMNYLMAFLLIKLLPLSSIKDIQFFIKRAKENTFIDQEKEHIEKVERLEEMLKKVLNKS